MKLTTREITMAGILGAITIVLGFTYLGYIPLPTPAGAATFNAYSCYYFRDSSWCKIGALVGTIFGLSAIYYFTSIAPIWVLFPARPKTQLFWVPIIPGQGKGIRFAASCPVKAG